MYLCWRQQVTLFWILLGGGVVISQKKHNGEEHRYRHVCSLWSASANGGGRELCLTRGLEGGDWNATAECQTLCPDGIITDSSKAALHNSASSLPQHIKCRKQEKLKRNRSRSRIVSINQHILNSCINMLKNNRAEMNRGGGVCHCYGRVYHSACLNSVKTFAREDEDWEDGYSPKLSSITPPTHRCLRPCYQGLLLKQAFLLGTQVNNQQFAKNKCVPASTSLSIVRKHKHVEESCCFSYISKQELPLHLRTLRTESHKKDQQWRILCWFVSLMLVEKSCETTCEMRLNKYQAPGQDWAAFLTFQQGQQAIQEHTK